MVTTTVAQTPPALPTEAAGRVSTYSQNACPSRCLVWASRVRGGCVGEEVLAEHLPVQRRDREPAVAAAVAVLDHRERRGRPGRLLLGLQDPGFMGLADLGGDHVQDPPAQHPQRLRVMIRGMFEQHPLRLRHHRCVDQVGREGVDGVHDHRRLIDQHHPGRERGPDRLVRIPKPIRRAGRAGAPRRESPSRCGTTSSPSRWRPRRGRPRPTPRAGQPGARARRPAPGAGSAPPASPQPRPGSSTTATCPPDRRPRRASRPRPRDPVPRIGALHAFGHDPSQAPATDSPDRLRTPCPQGVPRLVLLSDFVSRTCFRRWSRAGTFPPKSIGGDTSGR